MDAFQLGEKIIKRIAAENENYYPQKAHGCIIAKDKDGNNRVLWLLPSPLKKGHVVRTNIVGDVVGVHADNIPYLKTKGEPVFTKNSPFGNAFAELKFSTGIVEFDSPAGKTAFDVLSNGLYLIKKNANDAHQGRIISITEDGFDFEVSLKAELDKIRELKNLIKESTHLTEEAKEKHLTEIQRLESEIKEKRRIARKRRRTTTSIREQFLLDPEQNQVKRSKLLNGPLTINGGPGTGKTTLLIHRIQYMLDPEMENDGQFTVTLSNEEKSFIRNQKTGWIFFSPTELLKKYLVDAMSAEGLEAHDETVRTWEQQRAALKTAMGLFNAETGRPFQAYRNDLPLWKLSVKELAQLQKSFELYLENFFKAKIEKLESISTKDLPWSKELREIKLILKSARDKFRLDGFILTLNELSKQFDSLRLTIDREYRDQIGNIASTIQQQLTAGEREWFANLLRERRKKAEPEDDTEETENEEMVTAFEEEEIIEGKRLEIDINKLIKRIVRIDALSGLDANTKLSKADKEIIEKLKRYINKEKYPTVAAQSLFIKYFKPFLRGSDVYILSQFSRIYKSFRRDIAIKLEWLPVQTRDFLQNIINTAPRNTRLHEDELDFVLFLALRMARMYYTTSPAIFKDSAHPLIDSYRIFMKGLVAVDEATDFTPAQIGCMSMLSRPRLNSITLSGDLMQQMNERGVDNWDDLAELLPGIDTKSLYKSYRQTPKLLKIANALYKARFGEEPGFFAAEADDEDDPEPLLLKQPDFETKVNWIAHRIAELYNIYEKTIPNIAIFVRSNDQIEKLANALNENEILIKNLIKVKACIGEGEIGSAEFVRVFNINLIKGMEFESVFFIDVDEYNHDKKEILDKLIYVGVSRATYYLAITLSNSFPERLLPVKALLKENGTWSTELQSDY